LFEARQPAAVVIAGATFFVLFQLVQRLNLASAAGVAHLQESALDKVLIGEGKQEEREWIVWLVVALGLLAGWLLGSSIMNQTETANAGGVSITYPAVWSQFKETGAVFAAYDLDRGGVYGTRIMLRQQPSASLLFAQGTLYDAATNWVLTRQGQLQGFRLLKTESTKVQERDAVQVEYAYLLDARGSASGAMPALMHAVDTLVVGGDQIYVLTFAAESGKFDSLDNLRAQLLAGWRVP
jgi:hypothetical protein